jgi:hypothetical protein
MRRWVSYTVLAVVLLATIQPRAVAQDAGIRLGMSHPIDLEPRKASSAVAIADLLERELTRQIGVLARVSGYDVRFEHDVELGGLESRLLRTSSAIANRELSQQVNGKLAELKLEDVLVVGFVVNGTEISVVPIFLSAGLEPVSVLRTASASVSDLPAKMEPVARDTLGALIPQEPVLSRPQLVYDCFQISEGKGDRYDTESAVWQNRLRVELPGLVARSAERYARMPGLVATAPGSARAVCDPRGVSEVNPQTIVLGGNIRNVESGLVCELTLRDGENRRLGSYSYGPVKDAKSLYDAVPERLGYEIGMFLNKYYSQPRSAR